MSQMIDPRAPRVGAGITSVLALIAFADAYSSFGTLSQALTIMLFILFAWSVFLPKTHPYKYIFQLLRKRIGEPKELEDARPPRFAQQVGLSFATLGLIGVILGSQIVVGIALAFIFIAAFLNAFFNFCLGCQMYLLLKRFGLFRH